MEFIADDELVEITPKSIRIRKRQLKEHERKRASARGRPNLTHRQAVLLMICVTLMWSIAGIVTRHLDSARGFELTFWRSLFNALALLLLLGWMRRARRGCGARCAGRAAAVGVGPVLVRDVHRLHARDHAHHRGQRAGDDGHRAAAHRRCSRGWRWATVWRCAPGARSSSPAPASPGCTARAQRLRPAPLDRHGGRAVRAAGRRRELDAAAACAARRPTRTRRTCWRRCCWAPCCRRP